MFQMGQHLPLKFVVFALNCVFIFNNVLLVFSAGDHNSKCEEHMSTMSGLEIEREVFSGGQWHKDEKQQSAAELVDVKYGVIKCDNKDKKELDFFLIGDTGGMEFEKVNAEGDIIGQTDYTPTPAQWAVAMSMRALVKEEAEKAKELLEKAKHEAGGDGIERRRKRKTPAESSEQPFVPFKPVFVLNTGDNFYDHGLEGDDHFKKVFLDVYNPPPPLPENPKEKSHIQEAIITTCENPLSVNWYAILGNNDWKLADDGDGIKKVYKADITKMKQELKGIELELEKMNKKNKNEGNKNTLIKAKEKAEKKMEEMEMKMNEEIFVGNHKRAAIQINYEHGTHKAESKIWKMPSQYYVVEHEFHGGTEKEHGQHSSAKKAVFIMIQTVLLCGSSRKDFKDRPVNIKERERKVHMKWLAKVLKQYHEHEPKPDFLFVVGHYPLYVSTGDRAFTCAEELQKLFMDHEITAYLAGHEHTLKYVKIVKPAADPEKHLSHEQQTLHQIVSGAGSGMENCWHANHVAEMVDKVEVCYPDAISAEQHKKNNEVKKKLKEDKEKALLAAKAAGKGKHTIVDEKADKKKEKVKEKKKEKDNKPEEVGSSHKQSDDDVTVKDGGAFISVRLSATEAEFKFWAAGGQIYPFGNNNNNEHSRNEYPAPGKPRWNPARFDKQKLLKGLETGLILKQLTVKHISARKNLKKTKKEEHKLAT